MKRIALLLLLMHLFMVTVIPTAAFAACGVQSRSVETNAWKNATGHYANCKQSAKSDTKDHTYNVQNKLQVWYESKPTKVGHDSGWLSQGTVSHTVPRAKESGLKAQGTHKGKCSKCSGNLGERSTYATF